MAERSEAPPELEGFRQRLRELLNERFAGNQKAYSLAAGLKSQAHVGMILRGEVGGGVTQDVVNKLAAAAGANTEWLWSGRGPRERVPTERELAGLPPEQVAAVEWAAKVGATPQQLDRLRRPQKAKHTAGEWIDVAKGVLLESPDEPPQAPLRPDDLPKGRR